MKEARIAVHCIFGIAGQLKAEGKDPKWCAENCKAGNEMERHSRPYQCITHFRAIGVDLTKK